MTLVASSAQPDTQHAWRRPASWLRQPLYAWRFSRGLRRAQTQRPVTAVDRIDPGASSEAIWKRLAANLPAGSRVTLHEISLGGELGARLTAYWKRFSSAYDNVGAAREKALEHALTFELLDFARVGRYCDVAAAQSPIHAALDADYTGVEAFKQDLLYATDLSRRVIGGPAQNMERVADGFFDALTLHCSYEHFSGDADVEFLKEVDRVLAPNGACLIVPLYLGGAYRIYFDPSRVPAKQLDGYDAGAELCAAWHYGQDHGRYYSPEALCRRVLARLPDQLCASVLLFRDQVAVHPSVYLRFGMILHRPESVARALGPR